MRTKLISTVLGSLLLMAIKGLAQEHSLSITPSYAYTQIGDALGLSLSKTIQQSEFKATEYSVSLGYYVNYNPVYIRKNNRASKQYSKIYYNELSTNQFFKSTDSSSRLGLSLGIGKRYYTQSKHFSFYIGINQHFALPNIYSMHYGAKIDTITVNYWGDTIPPTAVRSNIRYDYNSPFLTSQTTLLVGYNFDISDKLSVDIKGGYGYGFVLNSKSNREKGVFESNTVLISLIRPMCTIGVSYRLGKFSQAD